MAESDSPGPRPERPDFESPADRARDPSTGTRAARPSARSRSGPRPEPASASRPDGSGAARRAGAVNQGRTASSSRFWCAAPATVRDHRRRAPVAGGPARRPPQVPVILREVADAQLLQLALIENIQRENLNPIDEASAYRRLLDEFAMTQEALADAVGKDRARLPITCACCACRPRSSGRCLPARSRWARRGPSSRPRTR